tara:strand:- start:685 stop:1266 length:582 start_codon:yes stop_codon:yes gene_type:complete
MVNAWSLLGSVLDGTLDEDYPMVNENDTLSVGQAADDFSIDFANSAVKGGMGEDHISFDTDPRVLNNNGVYSIYDPKVGKDVTIKPEAPAGIENPTVRCKYEEDQILQKASEYISSTYNAHYTNEGSNIQTLDLIESVGDAEAFCRSNAIKYLSRYDKKGRPKDDILKAIHYCVLLYHFTSKPQEISQPYETF